MVIIESYTIAIIMCILGGIIWMVGFSLMTLARNQAGAAISYGLGQGVMQIVKIR